MINEWGRHNFTPNPVRKQIFAPHNKVRGPQFQCERGIRKRGRRRVIHFYRR